jgi:ketosteroid isomerase-like protein
VVRSAGGREEANVNAEAAIAEDARIVASMDTEFQAAVKGNDAAAIDRILADNFVLVTGRGKTYTKADLLEEARDKRFVYERQEDSDQTVRVWGDTAVVTALLWAKGTEAGRYVFAQASTPLPASSETK